MIATVVINLQRDSAKWQRMQEHAPWKVVRMPAVDGRLAPGRPVHMNPFMFGCLLSHKRCWAVAAAGTLPLLILEDDCVFPDDFSSRLAQLLITLPTDFDVAMLGYVASDAAGDVMLTAAAAPFLQCRALQRVNADWWVPGVLVGSHCYLVSPAGGQKLLRNHDMYHADAVLCRDPSLNTYCPAKSLASQQQRVGRVAYNQSMNWEWLLLEPAFAVGPLTVRIGYLVALYAAVAAGLAMHKSRWASAVTAALISLPLIQYEHTRELWCRAQC